MLASYENDSWRGFFLLGLHAICKEIITICVYWDSNHGLRHWHWHSDGVYHDGILSRYLK